MGGSAPPGRPGRLVMTTPTSTTSWRPSSAPRKRSRRPRRPRPFCHGLAEGRRSHWCVAIHAAGPTGRRASSELLHDKAILEKAEDEEAIPLLVLEARSGAGAVHGD